MLTETPLIAGTDGAAKMSKSLDNQIELAAGPEETNKRIKRMVTDPQRQRKTDPGRPEVCNVYALHKIFNPDKLDDIYHGCVTAGIGCVDDKQTLADGINTYLSEFRERRLEFAAKPSYVDEVLADGAARAGAVARETIREVYDKMGLS